MNNVRFVQRSYVKLNYYTRRKQELQIVATHSRRRLIPYFLVRSSVLIITSYYKNTFTITFTTSIAAGIVVLVLVVLFLTTKIRQGTTKK